MVVCEVPLISHPSQRPDALPSGKAWPQVTICTRASVEACAAVRARFGVPSLRGHLLDIAHRAFGLHVATVVGSCTIACKKPRCFTVQWSGLRCLRAAGERMAGIWTQAGVGGFGSGYPPRILKRTESIVQSAVFTAALSNNPSTTNPHIKQNAQPHGNTTKISHSNRSTNRRDRKSTRLNSSHRSLSRMPSSA